MTDNKEDFIPISDLPEDDVVAISDLPDSPEPKTQEPTKEGLINKATEVFDSISKSIPLSDRIKSAGLIGRGVEAIENGIKAKDIPFVLAETASGTMPGSAGKFAAQNPLAAGVEQGAKLVGGAKDNSLYPKPATEEGEKLGRLGATASAFATIMAPVKEPLEKTITKFAAEQMKNNREKIQNATTKIVEFDSKVRGELFGARVKAGQAFDDSLKSVQNAAPDQSVDLNSAFKGLGLELDEAGQITGQNPKLLADLKSILGKAKNKTLERVLSTGDASNLTLEQTQDIVSSIKKIPGFAQKLSQGKFANWTDTDSNIIQFIEDVRDAQLSAFPEFEKTLSAYRETMHKFRAIKPYFKESNLINNIKSNFKDKPVIQSFVKDLIPKNVVKEMDSVRKVINFGKAAKSVAKTAAVSAAGATAVGSGVAIANLLTK
jgi:hypothetical protein